MAIVIASSSIAYAQQDTETVVVEGARKVTVVNGSDSQSVKIEGSADDPDYYYYREVQAGKNSRAFESEMLDFNVLLAPKKKTTKSQTALGLFNVYGGFMVNATSSYDFAYWHSGEYGFSILGYQSRDIFRGFRIKALFGFGWKEFASKDDFMYEKAGGGISKIAVPSNINLKKSLVRVSSVQTPIFFDFYLKNERIGLSFGPVVNFNYTSLIKNKYSIAGGQLQKEKDRNIHAKPVTVDYQVNLTLKYAGFYVKCAPHGIFDTKYSPDLNTVTVGVRINW